MKKNNITMHILLFIFTAGIGNIIYLITKYVIKKTSYVKSDIKYAVNNTIYKSTDDTIKRMIDPEILPFLERDARFRRQLKRGLVKITTHGGSCETCKKWEGKILNDDVFTSFKVNNHFDLLSNAIKQGLFHKGCSHGLTTYYPESESISYDKKEIDIEKELQEKINERLIGKSKSKTTFNDVTNLIRKKSHDTDYIPEPHKEKQKKILIVDEETGEIINN